MAIIGEDKYTVENNVVLNVELLDSLILLYQPLIGAQALALYLTLNKLNSHSNYSKLSNYSGLSSECLERALIMLERYRLVRTYQANDEKHFLHVLNNPLQPNEFLEHYVYGLEIRKLLGNFQYNELVSQFKVEVVDKNNYTEISEQKVFNLNQFDENDLAEILKHNDSNVVLASQFNFELFFSDVSELKFPSILRTDENLNLIAELALFYGISEPRMATLVYRSIDYGKTEFKVNKLIERVRREVVEIDENINKYELPNVAFLQQLLNGAAISDYQKQLLEELAFQMLLTKPVINRLIEYVMQINKNRLVRKYVLQIASTWKAYNIKTVDEANQLIKQIDVASYKQKQPETIRRTSKETTTKLDENEIAEIEKEWKRLGEQYGAFED